MRRNFLSVYQRGRNRAAWTSVKNVLMRYGAVLPSVINGLLGCDDVAERHSSGLRFEVEKGTVVALILVTTAEGGEFLNTRLFHGESDGQWRCVRWFNARCKFLSS